jgi:tetratricopeptide (TPR) repeat protein
MKRYEEALENYKKVIELDPSNKDAKKSIEDVNKVLKSMKEQQQ